MTKEIIAYVLYALACSFKFGVAVIFAPVRYAYWEVVVFAIAGGILGVIAYTYFGREIRKLVARLIKWQKPMSFARRKKLYLFWKKYGLYGIAFISPPLISLPLGVAIAVSFKEKPKTIILSMAVSIVFWACVLGAAKTLLVRLIF